MECVLRKRGEEEKKSNVPENSYTSVRAMHSPWSNAVTPAGGLLGKTAVSVSACCASCRSVFAGRLQKKMGGNGYV